MGVKVIDFSYKNYVKAMTELGTSVVQVGIFEGAGDDVVKRAIYNEFGTKHIPERSFIRSTFNEQHGKVAKRFEQILRAVHNQDYNVSRKLKLIGQEQQARIRQKITDIRTPPNSKATIAIKGFDNPLVHSGEMRLKVDYEVKNK